MSLRHDLTQDPASLLDHLLPSIRMCPELAQRLAHDRERRNAMAWQIGHLSIVTSRYRQQRQPVAGGNGDVHRTDAMVMW